MKTFIIKDHSIVCFWLIVCLVSFSTLDVFAQSSSITGPTSTLVGSTERYSITAQAGKVPTIAITLSNFGSPSSPIQDPYISNLYYVDVYWHTHGTDRVKVFDQDDFSMVISSIITINNPPVGAVTITGGVTSRCKGTGSTTFTANAAYANSYAWSISPGAGSVSNGVVTWASSYSGTATILVTASGDGGSTSASSVNVIVNSPGTLSITSNQPWEICQGSSARLTASGGTGYYEWDIVSSEGTQHVAGVSFLDINPNLNTTYYLYGNESVCSSSQSTSQSVTVIPFPTIQGEMSPTGAMVRCQGPGSDAFSITAFNATSYAWSVDPLSAGTMSGGTLTWSHTFSGEATVTAFAYGCNSSSASKVKTITVVPTPSTANAGPDQLSSATCGLTTVTLAATAPTVGTGAWSIVSGAGGYFVTAGVVTSTNRVSTFSGVAGSSYTLRWTVTNSPCTPSTDDVVITFNANPSTANAGPDQLSSATCGLTTVTLAATAPTVGTGAWSIVSGAGGYFVTPGVVTSTNRVSTFSGVAGSSYTLRWTVSNSPCTSSADDVTITFNSNPSTANAGPDQLSSATCGLTTVTLAATAPTVGTGAWSIVSGAGGYFVTPGVVTSTNRVSTFSGVAGSSYTLRWTVTNSPCTSSTDDVTITFNRNPSTANAGPDQISSATCGLTTVTLAATAPTVGTGAWSIVSGAGGYFVTAGVVTSTNRISTFSGVAGSSYTLRWTVTNSSCTPSTDDVTITFNGNPSTANAGPDQISSATCGLTTVTLDATAPTVGTGAWSIVSGAGGYFVTAGVVTSTNRVSTFSGVAGSSYTLRWTVTNSPCTSSADDVVVTFNRNPSTAIAGPDQTTCGLTTVTLAATAPTLGTGAWSIVSGTGGYFVTAGVVTSTNRVSTFSGVAGSSYTLRWTVTNGSCISSDDVIISFNQIPVVSAGSDVSIWGTGTSSIGGAPTAQGGISPYNYSWSPNIGLNAYTNSNPTFINGESVTYTVTVTDANNCQGSDFVTVFVTTQPIITASATSISVGSSVLLEGNIGFDSYQWLKNGTEVIGNQRTINITEPASYSLNVTKAGVPGNGTASITIVDAGAGPDMNYILTSIPLIEINNQATLSTLTVDDVSKTFQYFDGLGRPIQNVTVQGSPNQLDIVQPIVYDSYGRENKKYLPFTAENNGWYKPNSNIIDPVTGNYIGIAQPFYSTTSDKIADDTRPYNETIFEASPLSRPDKDFGVGADWLTANKSVQHAYLINSHGTGTNQEKIVAWTVNTNNEPVRSSVVTGYTETGGYYSSGQVSIKSTKDEDGSEVREYTDKMGRVILKKVQAVANPTLSDRTHWAQTYYIYDVLGNLRFVLPPELSLLVHQSDSYNPGPTDLTNWAFQYSYDGRKRMITKQVPGASPVYMVYDNRDRLVLTQDGNQRNPQQWTFTKYDGLNRPVLTGIHTADSLLTQVKMQARVNKYYNELTTNNGAWSETYTGNAADMHGYNNKSYPVETIANNYLTITYYDNYNFKSLLTDSSRYSFKTNEINGQQTNFFKRLIGQATGTKVKVLNGGVTGYIWLTSINYFDDRQRVIQAVGDNYKNGVDRVTNIYDFTGKVLLTKSNHSVNDMSWKDIVGSQWIGDKLTRTAAGNTWSASGAASTEVIAANADGWFEFTPITNDKVFAAGFSTANTDANWSTIKYSFYFNGSTFQVRENGNSTNLLGTGQSYNAGDVFRIERKLGQIHYYRNGALLLQRTAVTNALLADVAMYTTGTEVAGFRTSFGTYSQQLETRSFIYDHAGRLLEQWHKLNNLDSVLLVKNEYNELGQIVDKKLHSTVSTGANAKQSVDYRYNIRGWLTKINDSDINVSYNDATNTGEARDLFGMTLAYNKTNLGIGNNGLYNGNISAIAWSNNLGLGAVKENGFVYSYDKMNRLTLGTHKTSVVTNVWTPGQYEEGISNYDQNGNIKNLNRKGEASAVIDNLAYTYTGNQLLKVDDSGDKAKGFLDGANGGDDYVYDSNGNLVWDRNKGGVEALTNGSFESGNANWTVLDAGSRFTFINNEIQVTTGTTSEIKQAVLTKGKPYVVVVDMERTAGTVTINLSGVSVNIVTTGVNVFNVTAGTSNLDFRLVAGTTFAGKIKSVSVKGVAVIAYNFLNLPELVTKAGDKQLQYIYDATGRKLNQEMSKNGIVEKRTDYAGAYIYENDTLRFINHEEGRITMNAATPEYQYHLKDHLGNVRVTFTATPPPPDVYNAGYEDASTSTESATFNPSYNTAVRYNAALYNRTPGGIKSQRLSAANSNEIIGLTKSLKVIPGDTVDMEVYVKYVAPSTTNSSVGTLMLSSISAAFGVNASSTGEGALLYQTLSALNGAGMLINSGPDVNNAVPKAYINYILFDDKYVAYDFGFKQLTSAALENGSGILHEPLQLQAIVKQSGFAYIYLSNENDKLVDVFFDDLKITYKHGQVIQSDDYYPFGLTFNSYQRENSVENKIRFQGQEHIDDLDLGWDSFKWRNHQPEIGRFFNVDPLTDKYYYNSPYAFSENRVINGRELEGLEWVNSTGEQVYDPKANEGKGGYTKYATKNEIVLGNSLRNTPTGEKQFNKLVNSGQKTAVILQDGPEVRDKEGRQYGKTENTKGETDINLATKKYEVDVEESTITLNLGSIDALVKDIQKGGEVYITDQSKETITQDFNFTDILGIVFGHEIEHTTDSNASLNANRQNFESPAYKVSDQMTKEQKAKKKLN